MPRLENVVRNLVANAIGDSHKKLEIERERLERLERHRNTYASYAVVARIPKRDFNPIPREGTSTRRAPKKRTSITGNVQIE